MAKRSLLAKLLVMATSFAGGMALGILVAPKSGRENREWVNRQTSEFTDWVDGQSRDVLNKSTKKVNKAKEKVQRGIKKNVPNLYDATEEIRLDDSPILGV